MVSLYKNGAYLINGTTLIPEEEEAKAVALAGGKLSREEARKGTIAWSILEVHNC